MKRFLLPTVCLIVLLSSCLPNLPQSDVSQSHISRSFAISKPASPTALPQYYSPRQSAQYVSTATTIAVRYGPVLNDAQLQALIFSVAGSKSGLHAGSTVLADDRKTVIFKPAQSFDPGEEVTIHVSSLQFDQKTTYLPLSYKFTVAINQKPGTPGSNQLSNPPVPAQPPRSAFPDFLTVPQDIPHFTVSATSPDTGEGDVFVAPFYWTQSTVGSYLLILNRRGQLVYYRSAADALDAWDFKKQTNGQLSYYDQSNSTIYVMDSHYQVVATYRAGNGYSADMHDFQIPPNGNALLMIYDAETVDMSQVTFGGRKDAEVTGLVIQELDPSGNVIFEWRSWDHFAFKDSTAKLTDPTIDLIHGNALAIATDGNLLLSSRNLSEITKIDLQTGDILWSLGGKANMFTFLDGEPFAYQHDVRQLPNGDLTLFDNHAATDSPSASRGVEYKLDESNRTVTQVWQFAPSPQVFATYMGNMQRLENGNTVLGWGAPYTKDGFANVSVTEVSPDNHTLFELTFDQPYVSYRAFIFPWHGYPDTLPALAYKVDGNALILGYSWNGATEVAGYHLYGGLTPQSLVQLDEKTKTDFEMQSRLTGFPEGECYFQVAAIDRAGKELARSKIIHTDGRACP